MSDPAYDQREDLYAAEQARIGLSGYIAPLTESESLRNVVSKIDNLFAVAGDSIPTELLDNLSRLRPKLVARAEIAQEAAK